MVCAVQGIYSKDSCRLSKMEVSSCLYGSGNQERDVVNKKKQKDIGVIGIQAADEAMIMG